MQRVVIHISNCGHDEHQDFLMPLQALFDRLPRDFMMNEISKPFESDDKVIALIDTKIYMKCNMVGCTVGLKHNGLIK